MYVTTKLSKPRNPREPRQVNESLVSVSGYQKIGDEYLWVDLILEQDKYEIFKSADDAVLVSGKLKASYYKEKMYYSIYVNSIKAVAWADYNSDGQPRVDKRGGTAKPQQSKSMTTKDVKVNNKTDEGDDVFDGIGSDDSDIIEGLF